MVAFMAQESPDLAVSVDHTVLELDQVELDQPALVHRDSQAELQPIFPPELLPQMPLLLEHLSLSVTSLQLLFPLPLPHSQPTNHQVHKAWVQALPLALI
jgi:hypothetical protein